MRYAVALFAVSTAVATVASQTPPPEAPIVVAKNVQVSKDRAAFGHDEVLLAADSDVPGRLIGCSHIAREDRNSRDSIVYTSTDGGATWKPTLELEGSGDPACVFGPDNAAYYAVLVLPEGDRPSRTYLYRSTDGGLTWLDPTKFPIIDREFVAVDRTKGKYHGRIYVNGTISVRGMVESGGTGVSLFTSRDGGASFTGPISRASLGEHYVLGMGNSVVLSDGTVLAVFGELVRYSARDGIEENAPGRANAKLYVVSSSDGGDTVDAARTVGDYFLPIPRIATQIGPRMAVDRTDGPFKDRVYLTWPDQRSGHVEILFSVSTDKGKTWSPPRIVNDDAKAGAPQGPDHFMPTVVVNGRGVVGLSWFDRRDHEQDLGWRVRFTASLDGGETFLPSVYVSEASNKPSPDEHWVTSAAPGRVAPTPGERQATAPLRLSMSVSSFYYTGGHTSGLGADSEGVFHPLWIDNRTGLPQVWTTKVSVTGTAEKNGGGDLRDLEDVTSRVAMEITSTTFDRKTGTAVVEAQLKNVSKEPVPSPLKVRVIDARSPLGTLRVLDADNKQAGAGAVWDFSTLVKNGTLNAGETSGPRTLRFQLTNLRPFRQGTQFRFSLLDVQARVLARAAEKRSTAPAGPH